MKKLSPDTIEKLEWLKGRLRKYPHRYNQSSWCGTQACLAGYCYPRMLGKQTVTLTSRQFYDNSKRLRAVDWEKWLGVSEVAADLLFCGHWYATAEKFNRLETDTDEHAAEKACQRIDLFIKSGGTQ